MSNRPLFTVFTPTYNRGAVLHRVYESLLDQTLRSFEWIVIDDGSTDDTRERVTRWAREAWFPIRYFHQPNAGKHVAFNRAVREARGDLFLVADSDDAFLPRALERFRHHWLAIPEEQRERFAGVTALCMDVQGRVVGDCFPVSPLDTDNLTLRYHYRVGGEKWGFHRTDILRRFPFPEVPGERFVPEGVVWHRIARHYRTRFVNETLRIYYTDQPDQLTRRPAVEIPCSPRYYALMLAEEADWLAARPAQTFHAGLLYARFATLAGIDLGEQWRQLPRGLARRAWLLGLLPGMLAAAIDRRIPHAAVSRRLRMVRGQRRPLRFLLSRLLWRSGACRFFTVSRPGYRLRFHPSSLAAAYWVDPGERAADERFVRAVLRPGEVFVDVGANVGALTLAAARSVGPGGCGVAVEAHPRVCGYLLENLALNQVDWVEVAGCALGRDRGVVRFSDRREDDQNAVGPDESLEVEQRTLDEVCAGLGDIALLKLDVEGYEPEVLLGGRRTLERTRCIYLEMWDAHLRRYGWTAPQVISLLEEAGFSVYRCSNGRLEPLERPFRAWVCENVVAARDRGWVEVRLDEANR